jgi:hypothetical protein
MTVHLVKLCVGAESVDDVRSWIERKAAANARLGMGRAHDHVTRMRPRRARDLLEGGSLYWVIKGAILARQRIAGLESRIGADGVERTAILLRPALVLTQARPRRAFQGWRYLDPADAPPDLNRRGRRETPPELAVELSELGLL